jgi:hypothetical protein
MRKIVAVDRAKVNSRVRRARCAESIVANLSKHTLEAINNAKYSTVGRITREVLAVLQTHNVELAPENQGGLVDDLVRRINNAIEMEYAGMVYLNVKEDVDRRFRIMGE